jgi:transposase
MPAGTVNKGTMSDLFWLSDEQIERLRPFFAKSHGQPRVDDRRVLNGIVFVNRNGLRWRDAPSEYGPRKTLYHRWKRWDETGVFTRMMKGLLRRRPSCHCHLLAAINASHSLSLVANAVPAPLSTGAISGSSGIC